MSMTISDDGKLQSALASALVHVVTKAERVKMIWLSGGLGLVILLLAGDALVKGAVNLSLRAGIPAFIVSLTIVAFGTSAPELLISVNAALDNDPGIALGNVVGSNSLPRRWCMKLGPAPS